MNLRFAGRTFATYATFGLAALLTLLPPAARAAEPQGSAHSELDFDAAVERALSAYAKKDFARAIQAFDKAAELAGRSEDKATLLFNGAVAAFEEKDFEGAEIRFLRAARLDPNTRALCVAHAGLAALERGDVEAARRHLSDVPESDASANDKRKELATELERWDADLAKQRLVACLERVRESYGRQAREETRRTLEECDRDSSTASREQLDFLDLVRGYLDHDAEDLDAAEARYRSILERSPNTFDARLALGDLEQDRRRPQEALAEYEKARGLSRDGRDRRRVDARIASLYPLPEERFLITARLDLGYDTNAAQSGAARTTGFSPVGSQASVLNALQLAVERPFRVSKKLALGPFYSGNATLLYNPEVSDYSLFGHELGGLFYWAFDPSVLLRLGTSADVYFTGLENMQPFLAEAWLGAQLGLEHSAHAMSRVSVNTRREFGLSGRDALTGSRVDFEFRELFHFGSFAPFLAVNIVNNDIGTQIVDVRDLSLAVCDQPPAPGQAPVCGVGSQYYIPLGYRSLAFGAGTDWEAATFLRFSFLAKVEYRKYTGESYILAQTPGAPGAPPSSSLLNAKTREDGRFETRTTALFRFDRRGQWSMPLEHWMLVSGSNIAQDPNDPEHALDYDDRSFVQHVLTLGVRFLN